MTTPDTPLDDSISRLTAWVRDFGPGKNPQFIDDLNQVLEAARSFRSFTSSWPTGEGPAAYDAIPPLITTVSRCTCHERDGSYVCSYCYAQGHRGHMQQG